MIGQTEPLLMREKTSNRIDRSKDSFAYAQGIEKPYGSLGDVLDWCKSELTGDWRWQMVEMSATDRPGRYIFYFDDSRDCFAFALKWG